MERIREFKYSSMFQSAEKHAIFKRKRLFFWTSMALLALFALVEVHELIPFLHTASPPGDISQSVPTCPLCQIKYALALALFIMPGFLYLEFVRTILSRTLGVGAVEGVPGVPDPRGPPFLLFR